MKKIVLFCCTCLMVQLSFASIKLPKIFASNMVLQRDKPVRVWGWADAGEKITVSFNGHVLNTKAAKDSSWQIILPAMKYGGPFEMKITGKNIVQLTNILIGDVWLCSGQSNMEWFLKNANSANKEVNEGTHAGIRILTVDKVTDFKPQKDIATGGWKECNPSTVGNFSAVGYFFGRKLNRDLGVPIGLISSSYGGTVIQAWTSWEVMKQDDLYKNSDPVQIEKDNLIMKGKLEKYNAALQNDIGDNEKWFAADNNSGGWKQIKLPQLWEQTEIGNTDGHIWFKKEFDIPADMDIKNVVLHLGPVDDEDVTYLNGNKVGATQSYNADRAYPVDAAFLHPGKNIIVVKVTDNGGGGGLYGAPDQLALEGSGKKISLAGDWSYKPSALSVNFDIKDYGPNSFPSQLYNAMISPLVPFSIKGVIWYQGESNIAEGFKYRTLFPNMIKDWRKQWGEELPFIWVQIANLFPEPAMPVPSYMAELREAQHMTLSLNKTAEVVTIDIGDSADLHPRNKQDVGYRLALAAENIAYARDSVSGGPQYISNNINGNKVVLIFSNVRSGLMIKDKYGYLRGFAIAGDDKKFVWAKATLEGNNVIVYSDKVSKPVAVRYAWADNPGSANLYNKEGLPASPFRTDNWKELTEK